MDIAAELCRLLEQKKEHFLEYEQATLAMLDCEADDVDQYITQRGFIATEIDELTEQMARLCDGLPERDLLLEAAAGQVDFGNVPSEYHCVFYGGQAVRSVVNRIMETEKQVVARFEGMREEAREYIRLNQHIPKIKKYLANLADKPADMGLTNEKA